MAQNEKADFIKRLDQVLQERTMVNPLYSLRAFARDLGISPSQLSLIMNGKRGLSVTTAKQLVVRLGFNEHEQHVFVTEIQSLYSRNKNLKESAVEELNSISKNLRTNFLSIDAFSVIANWYHLALLEAIKLNRSSISSKSKQLEWLSKKLDLSLNEVKLAVARLNRLELVEIKEGRVRPVEDAVFVTDQVGSDAVRSYHRQIVHKALKSIDQQSAEDRYLRSTMMPIAKADLPKIKEKIKKFHESLIQEFGDSVQSDSVYALSTQFFNVLNEENKNEES